MRVVKNKAKMERIYNLLGIHRKIPSVFSLSIYMMKPMMMMMMMMIVVIIIIIIIMKLRNYRKQPYWALHTYFGKY